MKTKKLLNGFVLFIIGAAFSSCINLKSVNDFSSSAATGIKKFEDINYSFTQHCTERCKMEAVRKNEIKEAADCNCALYKQADSVTLLIYNALNGYFDGLTNLSNNALTDYKFDALSKALTTGNFGDIKIDETQATAYSEIAKIVSKATTDGYRRKKLKEYVEKSNAPVQTLLTSFQFIIQKNLAGELTFKKEKLRVFYSNMMDTTLKETKVKHYTAADKEKATMDYYDQVADAELLRQKIIAFAKSLDVIKQGHQKLYDNRNNMTEKEIKELLTGYASNIKDIISEFNKLKK